MGKNSTNEYFVWLKKIAPWGDPKKDESNISHHHCASPHFLPLFVLQVHLVSIPWIFFLQVNLIFLVCSSPSSHQAKCFTVAWWAAGASIIHFNKLAIHLVHLKGTFFHLSFLWPTITVAAHFNLLFCKCLILSFCSLFLTYITHPLTAIVSFSGVSFDLFFCIFGPMMHFASHSSYIGCPQVQGLKITGTNHFKDFLRNIFSDLSRKVGVHLTIIEDVKVGGTQIAEKCPINRSVIVSIDVVQKALLRDFRTALKPNVVIVLFLLRNWFLFSMIFFSFNMFLC